MKNSKKAFVDKILLGFFLLVLIIGFFGIISDQLMVKNKILALKKVAQTASLSAAKYYVNEEQNTTKAEEVANKIVNSIPLGNEIIEKIVDDINYTWKPDETNPTSVDVNITSYTQPMFWTRFLPWLKWKHRNIDGISSEASIVTITDADDFVPIAVNGCSQELIPGQEYDFLYKTFDLFDVNDNIAFYGLSDSHNLNSQASFAHFKNAVASVINGEMNPMNIHHTMETIATTTSDKIKNDVKQISQSFNIANFSGQNMTIALLDCSSTASDPVIKELIPIHMNAVYCAKACCSISMFDGTFSFGGCSWFTTFMCTILDMMTNITKDVFDTSNFWTTGTTNGCNQSNFFRINFEVRDKIETKEKVLLKY